MRRSLYCSAVSLASALVLMGCPPEAKFEANPTEGQTPLEVEFDASDSYSEEGEIVDYRWDFGDGQSESGEDAVTVNHTYQDAGEYTAQLSVINNAGASDTARQIIQANTSWARTYGLDGRDQGHAVLATADKQLYFAGLTDSVGPGDAAAFLMKTDIEGDPEWGENDAPFKTYGGATWDGVAAMEQTGDGLMLAGATLKPSVPEDLNLRPYLVKTDSAGELAWDRVYEMEGFYGGLCAIEEAEDGNYVVAGAGDIEPSVEPPLPPLLEKEETEQQEPAPEADYRIPKVLLAKVDSEDGEPLDGQFYGGPNWDRAWDMDKTQDGGYIVAGETSSFAPSVPGEEEETEEPGEIAEQKSVYLVKTGADLTEQWQVTHGGWQDDVAHGVEQTEDGGYIVAGRTESFGQGEAAAFLMKTTSGGDPEWLQTFFSEDEGDWSEAHAVRQTADEGYILVGVGHTESETSTSPDMFLLKTDKEGEVQWQREYAESSQAGIKEHPDLPGFDVRQTYDNGFIVVGWVSGDNTGEADVFAVKTDREGNVVKNSATISGKATTEEYGQVEPLADAEIIVYEGDGEVVAETTTDNRGEFSVSISPGAYEVEADKPGYQSDRQEADVGAGDEVSLGFVLPPETPPVPPEDPLEVLEVDTDKTEYAPGEQIEAAVTNQGDSTVYFRNSGLGLGALDEEGQRYPLDLRVLHVVTPLEPGETKEMVIEEGISDKGEYILYSLGWLGEIGEGRPVLGETEIEVG